MCKPILGRDITDKEGKLNIEVYNSFGVLIGSFDKEINAEDNSVIIQGFEAGLYIVKISINNQFIGTKKVIVTK